VTGGCTPILEKAQAKGVRCSPQEKSWELFRKAKTKIFKAQRDSQEERTNQKNP